MNNKVSIIMGIYNCENYLEDAINSILNQTYTNWELIMCDDCSTDNTFEVAKRMQALCPEKIVVIQNQEHSYLSYSLNHCLQYATGFYIARMDGDDLSLPNRLEKQVNYLQNNSSISLVGTGMQRFNEHGLSNVLTPKTHPIKEDLRNGVTFNHATIMTYKSVYDSLGGYKISDITKRSQDYELWFRFYHKGFVGDNIPEALYLVRENINAIKRRTISGRINEYKIAKHGFKLLGFPKIWLFKLWIKTMIKIITPVGIVELYRNWQKRRMK